MKQIGSIRAPLYMARPALTEHTWDLFGVEIWHTETEAGWCMKLARVQARIFRIEAGNLGDNKTVGHGVFEIRLNFGPGYRVYFGFDGRQVVVLLGGGSKGTQKRDIIQSRRFWIDYLNRT